MGKRSRRMNRLIWNAYDETVLEAILTAEEKEFDIFGERFDTMNGRYYFYQDNGADILAVAHLDSTTTNRDVSFRDTKYGRLVFSRALDDRLGAYVICDWLRKVLGDNAYDILLTTDEERGESTAQFFEPPPGKVYKWGFEFDRMGTDVVTYQYGDETLHRRIRQAGAPVGVGSFSDIAMLDHLGCKFVNWGVGYQEYHGPRSHAFLVDTVLDINRFVRFYRQFAGMHMKHERVENDWSWLGSLGGYRSIAPIPKLPPVVVGDMFPSRWVDDEVSRSNEIKVCPVCWSDLVMEICGNCEQDWSDIGSRITLYVNDEETA